jgi:cytochrome c oxidase assembly protein subunit 15
VVSRNTLTLVASFATALALVVVVLGAYVRLSDAGLGCPDWPGCYGKLIAPAQELSRTIAEDFSRPLEEDKAWKEMTHRYAAGVLGMVIVLLAVLAWRRREMPAQPYGLSIATVVMVIFQALLGMWTVTLLLKPLVVLLHLFGGFTILACLWWQTLRFGQLWTVPADRFHVNELRRFRPFVLGAFAILIAQISLGGWTSSNYAALACPDFPTCHGRWWPAVDFQEAFVLWRGIGTDYEGGVLAGDARVAIHLTHRVGAVVTFLYIGALAVWMLIAAHVRGTAFTVLAALCLQVALGIANVTLGLPLSVAVMHNAVAAILLLSLVTLSHRLWPARAPISGR